MVYSTHYIVPPLASPIIIICTYFHRMSGPMPVSPHLFPFTSSHSLYLSLCPSSFTSTFIPSLSSPLYLSLSLLFPTLLYLPLSREREERGTCVSSVQIHLQYIPALTTSEKYMIHLRTFMSEVRSSCCMDFTRAMMSPSTDGCVR